MLLSLLALGTALPAQSPLRSEAHLLPSPKSARTFELRTTAPLRDGKPEAGTFTFSEQPGDRATETGNVRFDALYALAVHEARLNSVGSIKDGAYGQGAPLALEAFQTGEYWTYVWTRDLAYSVDLGLASFDPARAASSLRFKTSGPKAGVKGGFPRQIVQDTGSGGSYPISSDRVVWALGADAALRWLPEAERGAFLAQAYPTLLDTLEQDRALLFDPRDGLYRGEQSFLDWREQTYPAWTKDHTLPVGLSKALSTNVLHYLALRRAAAWAIESNDEDPARRFGPWADALKVAINRAFWDESAGLYRTYLISEGGPAIPAARYDLLGLSLAILADIASPAQAAEILRRYPTGPHGPSVVWPQERDQPIYHNQAIWPFVTAYWARAGRHAGHAAVVEHALASLYRLAADNLSHMENFDFATGLADYRGDGIQGPVINSRRQLWSVAGYLSVVQDVVFGLETDWHGLRFRPFLTPGMRDAYFAGRATIDLRDLPYRGTRHNVTVRFPTTTGTGRGAYAIAGIKLNGRAVSSDFVRLEQLAAENSWEIELGAAAPESGAVSLVNPTDRTKLYAPAAPRWDDAGGAVRIEGERLALHFQPATNPAVTYTLYRDGREVARGWQGTKWVDPDSADFRQRLHEYAAVAVDPATGFSSHLTPVRRHLLPAQLTTVPFAKLTVTGGKSSGGQVEAWGAPGDRIESQPFTVAQAGRHAITVRYANGSGPINTGITCAVKRIEIVRAGTGEVVAAGYAVMPQLGTAERWEDSSPLEATLRAGESYVLRLHEDPIARNMSYLAHNARYTSWPGGGEQPYNFISVGSFHLVRLD
jgi:hypothetical protein